VVPALPSLGYAGKAASNVLISWGVKVTARAWAFSLVCAGEPDSGIAMTFPLRITQASATAAGEHPCAVAICASVWSFTTRLLSQPRGEYAMTGTLCSKHHGRTSRSM